MRIKALLKRALRPVIRIATYIEFPLKHRIMPIDAHQAIDYINTVHREQECSITAHNAIDMRYDLMIIVPVYNVAQYLEECIKSILTQHTQYSFHIVIVDDGSTDGSSDILRQFQNNEHITLISKKNGGLSSARNAGLRNIIGKYIMFVDSDDVVAPSAFETMLNMAFQWDADAVEGSVEFFDGKDVVEIQSRKHSQNAADITKSLRGQAWAKLYRGELFRDIQYPEGFLYEDSILAYCVHPRIKRAYTVSNTVYRYRLNPTGITRTSKVLTKSLDTVWITDSLFRYYTEHYPNVPKDERLATLIDQIALNYKRTELLDYSVLQSVFAISCSWMQHYFDDDDATLLRGKKRVLAKALIKHDYGQYQLICSRWRFLK